MSSRSPVEENHPWQLVWGQPYIDAERLRSSIEWILRKKQQPDFRTRLLIRDSLTALRSFFGDERLSEWLEQSPVKESIDAILSENLGEPGFRTIRNRLVSGIKRAQIEQIFEMLSRNISHPIDLLIGGSISTAVQALTARPPNAIDIVDVVPREVSDQRQTLEQIESKYGLSLGHVQSHYLPAHWRNRVQLFGVYDNLKVYVVDPYDTFVSKLSSKLEKHHDDLLVLSQKLDKNKAKKLLLSDGKAFLESETERSVIEKNWQFLFREPLVNDTDESSG